jgi:SAM-dependent methyltransferase
MPTVNSPELSRIGALSSESRKRGPRNVFRQRVGGLINRLIGKSTQEQLAQSCCHMAMRFVAATHRKLMEIQWRLPPEPEHFDHHIDLFYQWLATRNSLWLERGVFSSMVLQGGDVLELACGDGFNAKNFYSLRSKHVVACDFDEKALETARTKNLAPNIRYMLADIRKDMPDGTFDNVIWDAAIEHFTPREIDDILKGITFRLTNDGILSGYTIVERAEGKSLSHHEYEFKNKQDLLGLLSGHFQNVTVFETVYPTRHNLYFWASNGGLPFRDGWPQSISKGAGR